MHNQDFVDEVNGNLAPTLKIFPDLESPLNRYVIRLYPSKLVNIKVFEITQEAEGIIDEMGRKYFGSSPKFNQDRLAFSFNG